jgi:hypothetical protein
MCKIKIKSTISEKVLFQYESDKKATIKEALTSAVKEGAYLRFADLRGAFDWRVKCTRQSNLSNLKTAGRHD